MRRRLGSLIAFASLFWVVSSGYACSCIGPGAVCSIKMGSSTIFRGTVVQSTLIPDIKTVKRADGTEMQLYGNGTFEVRLSVSETFSGDTKDEQIVYTAQQGSACGFPFEVGREYVVFTYLNKGSLWTSRCSSTAMLEPGVENPAVTWMRAYKTAPHGSEIFGSVVPPRDGGIARVPATIRISGPENRTLSTDAEGKYSFRNLAAGEYSVAAQVPVGFATGLPEKITVADKGCAEMSWPVTYEGRIRGRVVDADGKPVADLRMELENASGAKSSWNPDATTDLDGSYEFEHLSPADYFVAARHSEFLVEYGAQERQASPVHLGPAGVADHVDFVLPRLRPTTPVTVKVRLPDGSAAPAGLYLSAFPNGTSGYEPIRTGVTDASGTAVLPLAFGRNYAVSVALDRHHPGCGFASLTFSEERRGATLVIEHPDACRK